MSDKEPVSKQRRATDVHSAVLDLNVALELAVTAGLRVQIESYDINRPLLGTVPHVSVRVYDEIKSEA